MRSESFSSAIALLCKVLVVVLLAGCAVKRERYDVPAVPLPEQFNKTHVGQELADEAASRPAALPIESSSQPVTTSSAASLPKFSLDKVLVDWWRLLGNQELDGLVERALANNHDLVIANLRIAQAKARAAQAIADKNPVLSIPAQAKVEAPVSGVGSVGPGGQIDSIRTYQTSLRGDWRVDLWGEKQSLVESSDLLLWRAAFQRDDTQRVLVGSVVSNYVEYLSLNDRLRVSRETEGVLGGMVKSVEQRLEKGDATITDLEQQRAAVFAVRATIPALEQRREDIRSALALLTGTVPGNLTLSERGIDSISYPVVFPGIPSALLLRRPDVRVVEARMLSADADIDVARARFLPPLDLTAQVGYGSHFLSQLFQPHTFFLNGIANLSATIFDSGKRNQEIEFARAVHEELVETYARVVYLAVREVEDSLNAMQKTKKRFEAQQEATNSSRRAWEYSMESYSAGAIDYLTLLDTQRTFHTNLNELHLIRMNRYVAMVNLFQALGGGVQPGDILPGKGWRPQAPEGADSGTVLTTPSAPLETDGIDWSETQFENQENFWMVELSGVYDRIAATSKWRDLRRRLAGLVAERALLPRRQGRVVDGEAEGSAWYRLFIAKYPTKQDAEKSCFLLRANHYRCRVILSKSLDSSGAITEPPLAQGSRSDDGAPVRSLPQDLAPRPAETRDSSAEPDVKNAELPMPVVANATKGGQLERLAVPDSSVERGGDHLGYSVQLGSFALYANAAKESEMWRGKGYKPFISRIETSQGTPWFTVRVGAFQQREAAVALAATLSGKVGYRGFKPVIVLAILDVGGNPKVAAVNTERQGWSDQ